MIFNYVLNNFVFLFIEKLTVVENFALQICTTFTNGRISNFYLPLENVQDVVINEVISKVIYPCSGKESTNNL